MCQTAVAPVLFQDVKKPADMPKQDTSDESAGKKLPVGSKSENRSENCRYVGQQVRQSVLG
jgi:hypothetical protein